ncbi:protein Wnt-10a-like isoform X2 [Pomacea canaliculata]|uniref:protein Wnt-10a-like isoform X2 n=1 Tax=Pomacea canaliculata TaxID=400727 RepID=UPI000D73BEAB|nr:protein Wnt-10a-like isoform X2 [Pomacea canaliculata]
MHCDVMQGLPGMILMLVVSLLAVLPEVRTMENDILRLNIPKEPHLDPNTVCKTYPELTANQYNLCRKYPDVTASAIQGVQIAIHECQFQLRTHRWNCSSLETKNKNPHSSPLLAKGYKETAFAYAISAAGVTHQVSTACSMGKLKSCGCDMSVLHGHNVAGPTPVGKTFEWGGCSHNVDFGERYAKKFLDSKEQARDLHSQINLHNNRAGRLAVIRNVRKQCKCHGMSGSCELQTCWKATPEFRKVGKLLKKKFEDATKVDLTNEADGRIFKKNGKRPRKTDLLFFEKSPNFCDPNPLVDSPGTTGRLCNKTSTGVDNCETLCCGRGYNTLKVMRSERCHCKFYWCCYVECKVCTYNEWVTVCK